MDCPECGGRLADYRLGDRAAVGCEDCGYVGIEAEHRGTPVERESWDEAVERFRREHAPEPSATDGADERETEDASDEPAAAVTDETMSDGTEATDGDPANGEAGEAVTQPADDES
jgi:DNA-directed RNA polymerase subunit M/transcription elongation factor TFIIS